MFSNLKLLAEELKVKKVEAVKGKSPAGRKHVVWAEDLSHIPLQHLPVKPTLCIPTVLHHPYNPLSTSSCYLFSHLRDRER